MDPHYQPYPQASMPHQGPMDAYGESPHPHSKGPRFSLSRLFKRERKYPFVMQQDGSFSPDARPFGSRSLCLLLLLLALGLSASVLLIVASLGPSAIDSVYTLKLCDTRGCDDGYLVFGVFSAASKDRSGSEKSANALNDGYSDLVNVVYPRDLGKNLVNDSKIPAGLILAALLVQVLVLGFLGAGVHSIFAYNRGLSHGFQIPELIPKRDRGLALLVAAAIISEAPLALTIAATVSISNNVARARTTFNSLSVYTGAWTFDDPQGGRGLWLLWAAVGVMGAMLPVALYLISRAAQPIAAIPGPPAANSHLEAGPPPHWDPVAMGHPSYAQQQYPGDYNFPGAATTQSAGHRGKDHLSRHFASPVSTASSTSSSSETSTSSPKPREMEEAYNRHPTIAEQLQHPAISPAQAYATRMSQPVGAHIEEADESQEPTEPAYTTQAPAPSHSKHKSHHKTKKHRHPKKKVNIRLPSPGSSPLQHDRSHYEYAPPASPSSSSIDPLAPPPPMPHAQPQGLSSIPKKKKKKKSYPMKPMMPLKTMEQQFHPGAAEREASKAQRYQQAAQSAGGMTQGGHPSYYGNVGAMRGPPGMAPPNQARSGLPQQFRYPGVAV